MASTDDGIETPRTDGHSKMTSARNMHSKKAISEMISTDDGGEPRRSDPHLGNPAISFTWPCNGKMISLNATQLQKAVREMISADEGMAIGHRAMHAV
jgi:hypothetical protein